MVMVQFYTSRYVYNRARLRPNTNSVVLIKGLRCTPASINVSTTNMSIGMVQLFDKTFNCCCCCFYCEFIQMVLSTNYLYTYLINQIEPFIKTTCVSALLPQTRSRFTLPYTSLGSVSGLYRVALILVSEKPTVLVGEYASLSQSDTKLSITLFLYILILLTCSCTFTCSCT